MSIEFCRRKRQLEDRKLVSKYRHPRSFLQRFTSKFLVAYLYIGISAPLVGALIIIGMVNMALGTWAFSAQVNNALGNIVILPALGLWAFGCLTPFALVGFAAQRKWLGFVFVGLYFSFAWIFAAINSYTRGPAILTPSTVAPILLVLFVFGTKFHFRLLAHLSEEPEHQEPKMLGCHGDLHRESGQS